MRRRFAEIEYHGTAGATAACLVALERLLHNWTGLTSATLVTCQSGRQREHVLVLVGENVGTIAIKSSFASGYSGEGPSGLSSAIVLLDWHGLAIEEVVVEAAFLQRLDASALTEADVAGVLDRRFVRPRRIWDYIRPARDGYLERNPWRSTEPVMPLALIDDRLQDLARSFRDDPATALLKAHIRLETIVREKVALTSEDAGSAAGSKLFSNAFNGDNPVLTWPGLHPSERQGRAALFTGTVGAYRNVRAHNEVAPGSAAAQLSEFILLNHLFCLERESVANLAYSRRSSSNTSSAVRSDGA